MNEQMKMEFPETFEEFAKYYGFKDDKEVYTNGSDLIPIFRVKQWLEHDNKLRAIEIDTAYECGKHANKAIPDILTNGDVIQALFPYIHKGFSNVVDLNLWWKAKYKADKENEE